MTYFYEYLTFLAETVTVVVALLVIISAVVSIGMRQQAVHDKGHLQVTRLNDQIKGLRHALESKVLPKDTVKKQHKREAKAEQQAVKAESAKLKEQAKADDGHDEAAASARVYVLRFEGDLRASHVDHLRLEVSALMTMATPADEVVVCVESPGGMVHGYGLAASQLSRIREHGIPLTACVDKVAASGGYMMAAVADKLIAAPFAMVGSIGVVAQIPNVHRWLKKNDVDVEVLTAGKYKRTLTVLGENTDEGRQKFVEELEDVHALFQEFVADNRPDLDIERVATGEAWYGKRALELKLVDELATSDEYLMRCCENRDVYELKWVVQQKPIEKLFGKAHTLLDQISDTIGSKHGV